MAQQPSWQRFAGSVAENYNRYLVPAIFEPWAEDLVALAAPRPGERVLDVACGPGVVARSGHGWRDLDRGELCREVRGWPQMWRFRRPRKWIFIGSSQFLHLDSMRAVLDCRYGQAVGWISHVRAAA
jgi:hypothetical protein